MVSLSRSVSIKVSNKKNQSAQLQVHTSQGTPELWLFQMTAVAVFAQVLHQIEEVM